MRNELLAPGGAIRGSIPVTVLLVKYFSLPNDFDCPPCHDQSTDAVMPEPTAIRNPKRSGCIRTFR
jgi:hypothetical protein